MPKPVEPLTAYQFIMPCIEVRFDLKCAIQDTTIIDIELIELKNNPSGWEFAVLVDTGYKRALPARGKLPLANILKAGRERRWIHW